MDDGIRERHGMACIRENQFASWVTIVEGEEHIVIAGQVNSDRQLTAEQARYLARKLYRLARRIEKRAETA